MICCSPQLAIGSPPAFAKTMADRDHAAFTSFVSDEAVFVGDSPHDIKSGNAAGVITIAALWGPFTRSALEPYKPTYFLDDIKHLPAMLDRIATKNAG